MTTFVGIIVIAYCAFIAGMIAVMAVHFRRHPLLPDRWTRGFKRWWARCWRWVGRIGPVGQPAPFNEPVITQAQMRQMQAVGRAVSHWNDRPIKLLDKSIQELADSEGDR